MHTIHERRAARLLALSVALTCLGIGTAIATPGVVTIACAALSMLCATLTFRNWRVIRSVLRGPR